MKSDKYIAYCIAGAQIASDAGKGIQEISFKKFIPQYESTLDGRYRSKDGFIIEAIKTINSTPKCGFNYYVTKGKDQNGYSSFIIYFDFKVNGKRKQVSFHCFNNKLIQFVGKGRKTRWDHQIRGSRAAANLLIKIYDL